MSDMKCPFCQDYLIPCIKNQNDWIYHCDNPKCPMYDDADNENAKHPLASEDLWQELIRTRKALEIAIKRLGYIKNNYKSWTPDRDAQMIAQAVNGLDEIKTALEQKDVK